MDIKKSAYHTCLLYTSGNIISEKIICDETISKADCIIPVPMSTKSFRPVSYTHLDVYKRQVTGLAFGYIPEIIDFTKKNNIL